MPSRLQERQETRKILLVISDGQPNGDADHLIQTVERIERPGCQGDRHRYRRGLRAPDLPDAIVVTDFRQMAEELLEILGREFRYS